jgi:hypothetical protein
MTTATKTKKNAVNKADLPPSADVITVSGRKYIIAPLDEFQEWDEDRQLASIMRERMHDGESMISFEEFEKRLDQKNRGKRK